MLDAHRPRKLNRESLHLGFYKSILINLIVLCGLIVASELSYRTWLYFRNCDTVCYNNSFFIKLDAFDRDTVYRFVAADPILGYSPAEGTFGIPEPGWDGAKITIQQGVRVNPKPMPRLVGDVILVVGGSFAFGDKVSDDDTWPAILERRLNRHVVNGGVSGY